jgi:glutamate formiminotransferase/formiminotetrahydrofolate cyclodeaminase
MNELASPSPAPGGGSVAAVAGALAASLVSMVSLLTIGKEKYRGRWDEMNEVLGKSERLRIIFLKLADEDTESFNEYMAALKMRKNTDERVAARKKALEAASKRAAEVPLSTLEHCVETAALAARACVIGNRGSSSDAGSAALLAKAAGNAAAYNVRINLPGVHDGVFVNETKKKLDLWVDSISKNCADASEIMDGILGR